MTKAIKYLKDNNILYNVHEYKHDKSNTNYGDEASTLLGIDAKFVYKTLIIKVDEKELVCALIPVNQKLSMKKISKYLGAKKTKMAEPLEVQNSVGYIMGAVSVIGQKKQLKTIIDMSAKEHDTIYISAGKRGLELEINPNELVKITKSDFLEICL